MDGTSMTWPERWRRIVSGGFNAGVQFGEIIAADRIAVAIGPRQRSAIVGEPAYFERWPKPFTPHDLRAQPCIPYRFDSGSH
jgi:hypothetical protein